MTTEKRYADIDKLVEAHSFFAYDAFGKSHHVVSVEEIKKAMSIDAVEIVRCKNCKYYESCKELYEDGNIIFEDDGFCHMGEGQED